MIGFAASSNWLIQVLLQVTHAARVVTPTVRSPTLVRPPLRFKLNGSVPTKTSDIHCAKTCSLLEPSFSQKAQGAAAFVTPPRYVLIRPAFGKARQ